MDDQTHGHLRDKQALLKFVVGLLMVTAILKTLASTTADPDLWGFLAFGRLFWESRRFPYQDVFSYVPTLDPWVYHEWLTGVCFYPLYQTLGAPGLQLLKYGCGLATAGLVYLTARKRGADPLSAVMVLWMVQLFLAMGYSPVRAQVFTYGFFALYLYLLEDARQRGRWRGLWFLIPLQVIWCNLHGGFLAGLGLLGLYALGEALSRRPFRPYLGALLGSGLATLINPYGMEYWHYILRAVSMPRPEITEWVSLYRAYQMGFPKEPMGYFLGMVAFSGFLAWWARWREITPALALAVTLYLGLKHQRHQVFFLLLAGGYLPVLLTGYFGVLKSRPRVMAAGHRLGTKIPTLLVIFLTVLWGCQFLSRAPLSLKIPAVPGTGTKNEIYYPVAAVDYLEKRGLGGKMLIDFNWGEFAIWTLYPRCRVALDGRYETVYPDKVSEKYFDFIYGRPNWRQFLEAYPPDLVLLDIRSQAYPLMAGESEWRQVYADSGCALFLREGVDAPHP